MYSGFRYSLRLLLLAALLAVFPLTVEAQTVDVRNDATVLVQNDAFWDLQGGTMNFGSSGEAARLDERGSARVANGQLTATRALNSPSSEDPAGLGLQITTSENLGDVDVTRGHTAQTGNGNEGIERYYDVGASQNNSGLNAELTLAYNDAELNSLQESKLEFFKSEDGGTSWSEEGFDSRDGSANTVTLKGIESLSRWTLGSESQPLPVELAAFEASLTEGGAVRLSWKTLSEDGNARFVVERRTEARQERAGAWERVTTVESQAPGGTSTEALGYSFTDRALPFEAQRLTYRLRQVDVDGSATVLAERAVEVGGPERFALHGSFPNPFQERTTIRYELPEEREVTIAVHDARGRKVRTLLRGEAQRGRQETTFAAEGLASGVYFVRMQAGDYRETRKLVLVR
jgi:hypothetical protein